MDRRSKVTVIPSYLKFTTRVAITFRVITKSVSHFGRNTVDTLAVINKLRELGIDVYFEKTNSNTL